MVDGLLALGGLFLPFSPTPSTKAGQLQSVVVSPSLTSRVVASIRTQRLNVERLRNRNAQSSCNAAAEQTASGPTPMVLNRWNDLTGISVGSGKFRLLPF